MPTIADIRCVLLTGAYAQPGSREVKVCFGGSHFKSAGFVEVTLDDGTTGVGEGYLAVFAPRVFESMVKLVKPYLVGRDATQINARVKDLCQVCDYWSMQGAARHVISAIEIALVDANAKRCGIPAFTLFGGARVDSIQLYASGGDGDTMDTQAAEIDRIGELGIRLFKTRGRNWEVRRTSWIFERAARAGIEVGVDMCQNLANPGQTVSDVVHFLEQVGRRTRHSIRFLEEALGPMDLDGFKLLRQKVVPQVCGGETITTPAELARRVADGVYDFVQPDATVIGGIGAVLDVFTACRHYGSSAVVHAWGAAPCLMANYHAAFAGGALLAEYPMPPFALRDALFAEPMRIKGGRLYPPQAPGIGIRLTPEIEAQYRFRDEAVYSCLPPKPGTVSDDSTWE